MHRPGVRRVVIVRAGLRRAMAPRVDAPPQHARTPSRPLARARAASAAFRRACVRCGRSRRTCWRDRRWLSATSSTGGDMPRIESIARRSSPPTAPIARRIAIGSTRSGATSGDRMPPCARGTAARGSAGLWPRPRGARGLLDAQNGVCAVCKLPSRRALCVDHCHATRQVRGLLCDKCNTALGLFGDDVRRMLAAVVYLNRVGVSPKVSAAGLLELLASLIGKPPRAARSRAQARRGCTRSQR